MNPFLELGIRHEIVNAIEALGFVKPSPIQEQAIPVLLTGSNDFVGLAQTGTGKTAAFGLPLLELLNFNAKKPQALVLCPTRELCLQIANDIEKYAKHLDNVNVVAVYGGASISEQLRQIRRGVQIVVATPGRMLDIIGRGAIDFSDVKYVVLDEADEMLNMGFQEDINNILSTTPTDKKTWLFSATMPAEVRRIAKKYMDNPFELTMGTKNTGNENIEHNYYVVRARDKYPAFKRIVDSSPDIFGIVFCRTKIETQEIAEALIKDGYNADSLHGDLSQQQRDKVMKRYRDRSLQLLVATDVAARGIDVNDVTHVINYSLPDEIENYTHRSGRTARAGKTGVSISLINIKELGKIRQVEKVIGKSFNRMQVPAGKDVMDKQLFAYLERVKQANVKDSLLEDLMPQINEKFEELSKEEILKLFVSFEFSKNLAYYENAPDLNVDLSDNGRGERRNGRDGGREERFGRTGYKSDFTRLFINLGSVDNFSRGELLSYICDNGKISGKNVGKIDIKGVYSFFEVQNEVADKITSSFKGVNFNGRDVRIENAGEGRSENRRSSGGRRDGGRREGGSFGGGRRDGSREGGRREGGFRDFSGKRKESKSGNRW